MGKKSRLKKQREGIDSAPIEQNDFSEKLLKFLILIFSSLSFFCLLFIGKDFYFPFVGPKSLLIMAICQIVFFLWLFLAIRYKKYRPKLNYVLISLGIFVLVLIISSLFGVDFSRSFWSKFERMTGLLMWFHLFGLFLALSSTFRKKDWHKLFTASTISATIISFLAILEMAGIQRFMYSGRGGSTLGNTSFLGTVLLFNIFLAIWLFSQKKHIGWRIYFACASVLMFIAIYLSEARAAAIATIGGIVLIGLLWWGFKLRKKIGKTVLAGALLLIIIGIVLLHVPGTFVNNKFVDMTGRARVVNWEMAGQAFSEKPLLGWGPENYTLAFNKYFNPCFFLEECGGEIWFDRVHNIIYDILVTSGIIGLLAYLSIFVTLFLVFKKRYKQGSIDFWTFAVFPSLLIAYFIQNLTVFDMSASLLMFASVLAFAGSMNKQEGHGKKQAVFSGILLIIIFIFTFSIFVIGPFKTDYYAIAALKVKYSPERLENYQKALDSSPLGRYQIREFFAERTQSITRENVQAIHDDPNNMAVITQELDYVISEMNKTMKEAPLDYRTLLRLANVHNVYYLINPPKIVLAEQYGNMALELSPTNQQGYWALAQTKILKREFAEAFENVQKAIDLEPRIFFSYNIGFQLAEAAQDINQIKIFADQAVKINPNWDYEIKDE